MSANIAVAGRPTHDDPESEAASFQDVADEDLAERLALRRVHYALSDPAVQRPTPRSVQPVPDLPLPRLLLGGLLVVVIACARLLVRLLRLRSPDGVIIGGGNSERCEVPVISSTTPSRPASRNVRQNHLP